MEPNNENYSKSRIYENVQINLISEYIECEEGSKENTNEQCEESDIMNGETSDISQTNVGRDIRERIDSIDDNGGYSDSENIIDFIQKRSDEWIDSMDDDKESDTAKIDKYSKELTVKTYSLNFNLLQLIWKKKEYEYKMSELKELLAQKEREILDNKQHHLLLEIKEMNKKYKEIESELKRVNVEIDEILKEKESIKSKFADYVKLQHQFRANKLKSNELKMKHINQSNLKQNDQINALKSSIIAGWNTLKTLKLINTM